MKKSSSKKKRIWIPIVIVLVIAAGVIGAVKFGKPSGTLVESDEIKRMDIEQTVDIKGIVEGTDSADVYSKYTNRIAEILVSEGSRVKTGDKLARLEDDKNETSYEKALMNLETAKREYENNKALYESGAISREDFLGFESRYKDAQLTVNEFDDDKELYVTSPIDGTVTRIYTSVGKLSGGAAADALFRIENIDQLQMRLLVSEYDITKVKLDQDVRITAKVIGKETVGGKVTSIAPTGEEKNPGSSNMVIPVTVMIDSNQKGLFAGVNAKASILTDKAENVLAVPVEAVLEDSDDGSQYVFAIRDNVLHKVIITTTIENDFFLGINDNSDLKEGDKVVLDPDFTMEDGMTVRTE